jgi:hypothetical protein
LPPIKKRHLLLPLQTIAAYLERIRTAAPFNPEKVKKSGMGRRGFADPRIISTPGEGEVQAPE